MQLGSLGVLLGPVRVGSEGCLVAGRVLGVEARNIFQLLRGFVTLLSPVLVRRGRLLGQRRVRIFR